ncbi:BRCT domain-containing protein [Lentisphaerota bacterium WC36G]|nr:BRCT domain-containing protein [Lentisphaerae bacterium WC36]
MINKQQAIEDSLSLFTYSYEEQHNLAERFNAPIRYENAISQLQGLAYAIVFDNIISNDELKTLLYWLHHNSEFLEHWPLNSICDIFLEARENKSFSNEQRTKLFSLLEKIGKVDDVCNAIFDDIDESDHFYSKTVIITGNFNDLKRAEVLEKLYDFNITAQNKDVTFETDYVVVGAKGSRNWRFGKFGRKIEKAIEYRDQREVPLKIINEETFFKLLQNRPANLETIKNNELHLEQIEKLNSLLEQSVLTQEQFDSALENIIR